MTARAAVASPRASKPRSARLEARIGHDLHAAVKSAADLSRKGLLQSAGMAVNYLYDLDKVEEQHEAFSKGVVTCSRRVAKQIA